MLYHCDVSCRFFQYMEFSDSEVQPDDEDRHPTSEVMQEIYKDFAEAVHSTLSATHWGTVSWIEVSVGDDNDDYEDCTQIDYFFRVGCTLTEHDVERDSDTEVEFRVMLRLTEEALNKLKSELEEGLWQHDYSINSLQIETTEPEVTDAQSQDRSTTSPCT